MALLEQAPAIQNCPHQLKTAQLLRTLPWAVEHSVSAGRLRVPGSRLKSLASPPTAAAPTSSRRRTIRGDLALGLAGIIGGAIGGFYLADPTHFHHNRLALVRSYRAGITGIAMGLDYKWSLRNGPTRLAHPHTTPQSARVTNAAPSACSTCAKEAKGSTSSSGSILPRWLSYCQEYT
ncbi:hypothetical protein HDU88_005711 [Geranomyces variabilis]|nr:hypothetical protein HDU88_005711 [Geranomyces variabilis]